MERERTKHGSPREHRAVGSGPPPGVGERLRTLEAMPLPRRLDTASPAQSQSQGVLSRPALAVLVAARLRELRALDELARYLHRGQIGRGGSAP